jgi:hypothetical protein
MATHSDMITDTDHVRAIVRTLNASYNSQPLGLGNVSTTYPVSAFITDMVYLKETDIVVNVERLTVSMLQITFRRADGTLSVLGVGRKMHGARCGGHGRYTQI